VEIEKLFRMFSTTESNLSASFQQLKDWEEAIYSQEQSILSAKQLKDGEDKMQKMLGYLSRLANLYFNMGKLTEAKAMRE
jgi:tetratricopeptide (TPR) repeat protein